MFNDSGSNQISACGLRLLSKGNYGHVHYGLTGCNWAVIKGSQIVIVSIPSHSLSFAIFVFQSHSQF